MQGKIWNGKVIIEKAENTYIIDGLDVFDLLENGSMISLKHEIFEQIKKPPKKVDICHGPDCFLRYVGNVLYISSTFKEDEFRFPSVGIYPIFDERICFRGVLINDSYKDIIYGLEETRSLLNQATFGSLIAVYEEIC